MAFSSKTSPFNNGRKWELGRQWLNLLLSFMVELLGIIESWHQCLFSWNCALLLIQLILYIFCVRLFIFVRKFSVQVFKFVRIFNKFGTELTVFRCSTCKIPPWFRDFFWTKWLSSLIFSCTLSQFLESL